MFCVSLNVLKNSWLRYLIDQITGYLKRLDQAEASVGRIQADAATKSSLDAVRADLKRNTVRTPTSCSSTLGEKLRSYARLKENSALDLLDLRNHVRFMR